MEAEVIIASPPDRDFLVAEIWFENDHFAELNIERGEVRVELYPHPTRELWDLPLAVLKQALKQAESALVQDQDDPPAPSTA